MKKFGNSKKIINPCLITDSVFTEIYFWVSVDRDREAASASVLHVVQGPEGGGHSTQIAGKGGGGGAGRVAGTLLRSQVRAGGGRVGWGWVRAGRVEGGRDSTAITGMGGWGWRVGGGWVRAGRVEWGRGLYSDHR